MVKSYHSCLTYLILLLCVCAQIVKETGMYSVFPDDGRLLPKRNFNRNGSVLN